MQHFGDGDDGEGALFLFPWTVMIADTGGQIPVYNKDEIRRYFNIADYKDCRINALPKYTSYSGINRQLADFIFIDLDLNDFGGSIQKLNRVENMTCNKIQKIFGDNIKPTVLQTGGGYHIYVLSSGNVIPEQYVEFGVSRFVAY